jgi:hypothetical protein
MERLPLSQFKSQLNTLAFENEESRLKMLRDLQKLNKDMEEARVERETISKQKIVKVSSEIDNIESNMRKSREIGSFEIESRRLASLLTDKNDLNKKLG